MKFKAPVAALLWIMIWPSMAWAHVHMDKSIPADGASLATAPTSVQLWFTGKVAAEWSKVEVTDGNGKRVDKGSVVNGDDPRNLRVELQPLPSGHYDVKLNVISGDGHRVKGSFSFTIQ